MGLAAYSTRAGECVRGTLLAGDAAGELAVRWICTTGSVDIAAMGSLAVCEAAATCEAAADKAATVCGGATTVAADRTMGDATPPPRACAAPSIVGAAVAGVVLGTVLAMGPEAARTPGTQDRGDIVGMCDKPPFSCDVEF